MVDAAGPGEEHQVAGLHVVLRDAARRAGLRARRARQVDAGLAEAVLDETGAVELGRARRAPRLPLVPGTRPSPDVHPAHATRTSGPTGSVVDARSVEHPRPVTSKMLEASE